MTTVFKTQAQKVAEIRAEIKAMFPEIKFSISKDNYNGVMIKIMKAPASYNLNPDNEEYYDVNEYRLDEWYSGKAQEVFKAIYAIASKDVVHYDTADYGRQPSFYISIGVGRFDKPFQNIEA